MLIRETQMTKLTELSRRKFEDRVAAHLTRCFPADCRALGESGLQEVIGYGIQQAAKHGFELERDVCKYIDVMFTFGRDFDRHPDLPWAAQILEDDSFKNPTARMERLFSEARQRSAALNGGRLQ
jgi:hypothetical protein